MILPEKLQLTLELEGLDQERLSLSVGIFHSWISGRALNEVLVDVADYRHVTEGPGIVLVGQQSNYMLAIRGGRGEFVCFHKRLTNCDSDPLLDTVNFAFRAGALLEAAFATPLVRLNATSIELCLMDGRASSIAPLETQAVSRRMSSLFGHIYESEPKVTQRPAAYRPTFVAHWYRAPSLSKLVQRLDGVSALERDAS